MREETRTRTCPVCGGEYALTPEYGHDTTHLGHGGLTSVDRCSAYVKGYKDLGCPRCQGRGKPAFLTTLVRTKWSDYTVLIELDKKYSKRCMIEVQYCGHVQTRRLMANFTVAYDAYEWFMRRLVHSFIHNPEYRIHEFEDHDFGEGDLGKCTGLELLEGTEWGERSWV